MWPTTWPSSSATSSTTASPPVDQRVDQSGLRLLAECVLLDEADRLAIPRRRRAYRHHAHESFIPFSILRPAQEVLRGSGLPPAR